MPGHIFDTNTLRNFVLCSAESLLPQVCPGNLYWSGIVKDELLKGPAAFRRLHQRELLQGDPDRTRQLAAFEQLETALSHQGFRNLRLTATAHHAEKMAFFACCLEEEEMDAGEAESLAWAAFNGLVLYTDDLNAYRAVERYNAGEFRCPPYGADRPPQQTVEVHSTPWLLMELVRQKRLAPKEAEQLFAQIMQVWYRHLGLTLAQLRQQPDLYW